MANDAESGTQVAATAPAANFRSAMSQFPTGVTVVSCEDGEGVHGMTCNSFTSISLDPASILVSLKPGRTHHLVASRGRFGVSILNESHEPLAKDFCGARAGEAQSNFVTRRLVPTLRDALAWFECRLIRQVEVHDHTLFVARVEACGSIAGGPLVFFGGSFYRPTAFGGGLDERAGTQGATPRLSSHRPGLSEA
ncbi:styrene monooxygenase NADH-dependent flavin reductase subunit StyB [Algiphilus aromaticivorans]|uniref:styrene monooxygenase NADH-dependent flavin reductase subunit StyB n=1 Tax=Algiphilus aromaticivorans TaxID=382454 RepID=UPI000A0729C7|nr:flavin reductase family protein [Algiphilus aromaticivorans]